MMLASTLSILFSGVLLTLLGLSDPKRIRNMGHGADAAGVRLTLSPAMRRSAGWLSLAPGVVLAGVGEWWAFFVWLGAATALGWTVAQVLTVQATRPRHRL